jgi:hypothetical protein
MGVVVAREGRVGRMPGSVGSIPSGATVGAGVLVAGTVGVIVGAFCVSCAIMVTAAWVYSAFTSTVGAGVAVGVQAAMTTEMRSRELIPMCLRFRFI